MPERGAKRPTVPEAREPGGFTYGIFKSRIVTENLSKNPRNQAVALAARLAMDPEGKL